MLLRQGFIKSIASTIATICTNLKDTSANSCTKSSLCISCRWLHCSSQCHQLSDKHASHVLQQNCTAPHAHIFGKFASVQYCLSRYALLMQTVAVHHISFQECFSGLQVSFCALPYSILCNTRADCGVVSKQLSWLSGLQNSFCPMPEVLFMCRLWWCFRGSGCDTTLSRLW